MFKKCWFSLFAILVYTNITYSSTHHFLDSLTENVESILEHENYCVIGVDNSRIYINPENIFPTQEGIFIRTDGINHVLAPPLFSDNRGCFVETALCNAWVELLAKKRCRACKRPLDDYCTNPACPNFGIWIPQ